MNILFWVIQGLLAVLFLMTGIMKLIQLKEKLLAQMKWPEDFSQPVIRVIGIFEILGGLGLVLPALTGVLPWLTPLAAAGLVLLMVGAALTHYRRKEFPMIGGNMILLVLALAVAIGRFWIAPL